MTEYTLTLDSKKRITLGKLLKSSDASAFKAVVQGNGDIVLKPMASIPERELWLYKNKAALRSVKRGLSQKGTIKRGSFAKYAKD